MSSAFDLSQELGKRIVEAAKSGGKDGFIIKMGRHTGNRFVDPLGEEVDEVIYDQEQRFYKQSMSTQDYKRYIDARVKLSKETDENKKIDLTLRLYEYLAMKFLGMTHEQYINADFDDVVVAALACDMLFGSGSGTGNNNNPLQVQQQIHQPPTTATGIGIPRQIIHTNPPTNTAHSTYYKAPDEE